MGWDERLFYYSFNDLFSCFSYLYNRVITKINVYDKVHFFDIVTN